MPLRQGVDSPTKNEKSAVEECLCCCPTGCLVDEPINPEDPEDAVRMVCTYNTCTVGEWMHKVCFDSFEEYLMNLLRNSSKTRGWSDRHRQHSLWSRKGHEALFKAYACLCGHGYLTKDLDYQPPNKEEKDGFQMVSSKQRRQRRRTASKQLAMNAGGRSSDCAAWGGAAFDQLSATRQRSRALSLGSAATKPTRIGVWGEADGQETTNSWPNGSALAPVSAPYRRRTKTNSVGEESGYFNDVQVKTAGSIFKRRESLATFYEVLPRWKVNGFHIKLEDECPQGNDDTRIFLLMNLGDQNVRRMDCLLCSSSMDIYDRYPLLDGVFFISPVNHNNLGIPVRFESKDGYLLALCVGCMEHRSHKLRCLRCGRRGWMVGSELIFGGLYNYDLLSMVSCCPPNCKRCGRHMPLQCNPTRKSSFSSNSEPAVCPHCGSQDYHLVRSLDCIQLEEKSEDVVAEEQHLQQQEQRSPTAPSEVDWLAPRLSPADLLGRRLADAMDHPSGKSSYQPPSLVAA